MTSERTKFRRISKLIKDEEIVRLAKGIYVHPVELEGIEGDFYRATLLAGRKSAICLFSALQFYGLTEQMFGGVWVLIPYSRKPPRQRLIRAVRSRAPHFRIGVIAKDKFRITTVERTIVDCFRYKRLVGVPTAIEAMRKAIADGLTTKDKIFSMAKRLHALKGILPYLEAA